MQPISVARISGRLADSGDRKNYRIVTVTDTKSHATRCFAVFVSRIEYVGVMNRWAAENKDNRSRGTGLVVFQQTLCGALHSYEAARRRPDIEAVERGNWCTQN